MSEFTPKSPELIQAQLATFAAERVVQYEDSDHIFKYLGALMLESPDVISRVSESAEYQTDASGQIIQVPKGTERTVAMNEEYTEFLRSVGGSKYEAIQGRADMLRSYGVFAPTISRLRSELKDSKTRKLHPAYLGNGSNATVFSISSEGRDYAVRMPSRRVLDPGVIDSHLAGAVLGKGVPHLEQIVAASYEDGVTVAELMPGREVGNLTVEDIRHITDSQLSDLVDTLQTAHERGIEIDPKPSNFFYDREVGFGIVDYHSSNIAGKTSRDQQLGDTVGWVSTVINNTGFYGREYTLVKTVDEYAHDLDLTKANHEVLIRYRAIVQGKLEGVDLEKALAEIDSKTQSSQETVEHYSNPVWVAEQVANDQESARRRAEYSSKQKSPIDDWLTLS